MEETAKRFYAFISYNHGDRLSAIFVKRVLELFFIPSYIRRIHKKEGKYHLINTKKFLRPIFRDEDNMPGGRELEEGEIKPNLKDSVYLIVLCSPNALKSAFVGAKEVAYFVDPQNNRQDYIIPLVLKGDYNNLNKPESQENEYGEKESIRTKPPVYCYPEELRQFLEEKNKNNQEILTIAVKSQKVGFWSFIPCMRYWIQLYKATIRIAARILGENDFDKLWKKNLRLLRWITSILFVILSIAIVMSIPTRMTFSLIDDNHELPSLTNGMVIVNHYRQYPISQADTTLYVEDLPGYYKFFCTVPVRFHADYYEEKEMIIKVWSDDNVIKLKRDSTFAIYDGFIIDQNREPISNVFVEIDNQETTSDSNGYFRIVFPVEKQTVNKLIKLSKNGLKTKEIIIEPTTKKEKKAQFLMSNK